MIRISLLLASLLLVACNYSDPKFGPNAGPDVGPVADPLAATIDVSNENAELMDNDPLLYEQQEAEVLSP